MKKWRDLNGKILREGDMIEDVDRRVIGKVVYDCGLPCVLMQKQFRPELLGYELLDWKGPKEAYMRGLVAKHTKLWWWAHRYTLNVIVLIPAERHHRSIRNPGIVQIEAPVPWG